MQRACRCAWRGQTSTQNLTRRLISRNLLTFLVLLPLLPYKCKCMLARVKSHVAAGARRQQARREESTCFVLDAIVRKEPATLCGLSVAQIMNRRFMATMVRRNTAAVTRLASPIPPPFGPPKNGHFDASPVPLPLYRTGVQARSMASAHEGREAARRVRWTRMCMGPRGDLIDTTT